MGIRGIVARLLSGDGTVVVIECRRCGASVGPETERCPECGGTEFSQYEL